MIFSQNLFRHPTPTCIVCRISFWNSLCWGPAPQLAHYCKLAFRQLLYWDQPQLALFVEFLFEILCVGAPPTCTLLYAGFPSASMLGPTPTRIACRISFRNSLCWGPAIIVKRLLQSYFHSINYCLYIIVKLWTLIEVTEAYRLHLIHNDLIIIYI